MADVDPNVAAETRRSAAQRARGGCNRFWNCLPPLLVLPLIALIIICLLFAAVGPVFLTYTQDAARTATNTPAYYVDDNGTKGGACPDWFSSAGTIFLNVSVPQITAVQAVAKVVVEIKLSGDLSGVPANVLKLPDNWTLTVIVDSFGRTFKNGDTIAKLDYTQGLTFNGSKTSATFYPFDGYDSTVSVVSFLTDPDKNRWPLSTCVYFFSSAATFESKVYFEGELYPDPDDVSDNPNNVTYVGFTAVFTRNGTTMFFSIFIVILLWGVSGWLAGVCFDHVFIRPREPLPPTIGFFFAALFAIPAVRNVQPDIPYVGAAVDVIGFFWNMSLVGVVTIVMLSAFVAYHKYGGKPQFRYKP